MHQTKQLWAMASLFLLCCYLLMLLLPVWQLSDDDTEDIWDEVEGKKQDGQKYFLTGLLFMFVCLLTGMLYFFLETAPRKKTREYIHEQRSFCCCLPLQVATVMCFSVANSWIIIIINNNDNNNNNSLGWRCLFSDVCLAATESSCHVGSVFNGPYCSDRLSFSMLIFTFFSLVRTYLFSRGFASLAKQFSS